MKYKKFKGYLMKPIAYFLTNYTLCNNGVELRYCIKDNFNMIKRSIELELKKLLKDYPVVTILGTGGSKCLLRTI